MTARVKDDWFFRKRSCQSATADIGVSGTGSATVRVSDRLKAEITGIGSIRYHGDPSLTQTVTGLGHVTALD